MAKRLVEWMKPQMHNVADIFVLKPGMNEIEEELFDKAMEIKLFAWMVEEGHVKVRRGAAPTTLAKLQPKEAGKLIKATLDKDLLEKWQMAEKRPPVVAAIQAQIELITPKSSGASAKSEVDAAEAAVEAAIRESGVPET